MKKTSSQHQALEPIPQTKAGVIGFGKYKGRPIEEVLDDDLNYLQWLANQPWFREQHVSLYKIIINRGPEPQDTPEHNAIQVRFLDGAFCYKFCSVYSFIWKKMFAEQKSELEESAKDCLKHINEHKAYIAQLKTDIERLSAEIALKGDTKHGYDYKETRRNDCIRNLAAAEKGLERDRRRHRELKSIYDRLVASGEPVIKFKVGFEVRGVDVRLRIPGWYHGLGWKDDTLSIEIKPTVGDDYPSVLRQMKRTDSEILLVAEYTGVGATKEQFVKTFETAKIAVIFLSEVESMPDSRLPKQKLTVNEPTKKRDYERVEYDDVDQYDDVDEDYE